MNHAKKWLALLAVLVTAGALYAANTDTQSNQKLYDKQQLQVHNGTTTINTASQTYTNWVPLIVITPNTNAGMMMCRVVLDLDLATTGWHSTGSSATITFAVTRKVDGTNWRQANNTATTALSGTNAGTQSIDLSCGEVGPTEQVAIYVKVSSATGLAITNIPYVVYYRAPVPAVLTLEN